MTGPPGRKWVHARGELSLKRCAVMGIVNRTPDSFYDGGRMDLGEARAYALALVEEGADVLDVGAVKAGPGEEVDSAEEIVRLIPLVEAIVAATDTPVSVETARPGVARAALEEGAAIVNDVSGFADPSLAEIAAEHGAGMVLMHHGGQVRGRPRHPRYEDVVAEVATALTALAGTARLSGVGESSIVIDPGLDFGKTTYHSLELVRRLEWLTELGYPVLVAPSRKDVVGETLNLPVQERLEGTLALVALSVAKGAGVVRVHDVAPARRVTRMVEAVYRLRPPASPVRGLWD